MYEVMLSVVQYFHPCIRGSVYLVTRIISLEFIRTSHYIKYIIDISEGLERKKHPVQFSKSTGGEQPVEDIPIFTSKYVCLLVYVSVRRLLANNDKRYRPENWYAHSPRPYLKNSFLFLHPEGL